MQLKGTETKRNTTIFHNATYNVNLIMKYIGSNEMYGD